MDAIMKNLKRFKIQLIICAAMGVLAVAAALISGLFCDERTTTAVRIYCVIHPAAIVVAIALETLFLVSPLMMDDTKPETFFYCGTETSVIATAICGIVIITTERQTELVASIIMPYIILTLIAFAIGLATTRIMNP